LIAGQRARDVPADIVDVIALRSEPAQSRADISAEFFPVLFPVLKENDREVRAKEGKGDILNFKVSAGHDKPSLNIFRFRDEKLEESDNFPILTCLSRISSIVSKPPS